MLSLPRRSSGAALGCSTPSPPAWARSWGPACSSSPASRAAFLLGLVFASIAAACHALSSAQLAAYPLSGGAYEYGHEVLHLWLGFAAG